MPVDIKDGLYSAINKMGRERIRMDVAAHIRMSEKYCKDIMDKCTSRLGHEVDDETLATLCGALLHFMLTASLLPSERKVVMQVMQGADLGIIFEISAFLSEKGDRGLKLLH